MCNCACVCLCVCVCTWQIVLTEHENNIAQPKAGKYSSSTSHHLTVKKVSFCSLIKGITLKIYTLCFVIVNSVLINLWILFWLGFDSSFFALKWAMCSNPEKWHTKEDITIITMVHRHCFKTKKAARTITKSDGGAEGGRTTFLYV